MENIFSTNTKDNVPLWCRELCLQHPYLYIIHSDLDQCILKFYLSLIYPNLNPLGKYFWLQYCLLAKTRNCFDKSFIKWDKKLIVNSFVKDK